MSLVYHFFGTRCIYALSDPFLVSYQSSSFSSFMTSKQR